MVKIRNVLGEVKKGVQGEAVYQGKYGQQIRRTRQPKRAIASEKQLEHRQLYREALAWRKALSLANRRYLDGYCIANWVVDDYQIPLPWSRFALKLYLEHVKFDIITTPPLFPVVRGLPKWKHRVKLIIPHTLVDDTLTNFPLLIRLGASVGRNSKDLTPVFDELGSNANRKKIAVTTSNGVTQCYVEIEEWDDANEQAWLWVKVPHLSSGTDTTLYLYYDKTQPDNNTFVGDPNSTPAETVWGNDYVFVSHMRDDPDNQHIRDSSQYNNDGTKQAADHPFETTPEIMGGVQDYNGVVDFIDLGTDAKLNPSLLSVFSWFNKDTITALDTLIARVPVAAGIYCYYIRVDLKKLTCAVGDSIGTIKSIDVDDVLAAGVWMRAGLVYDGTLLHAFLDKEEVGTPIAVDGLKPALRVKQII